MLLVVGLVFEGIGIALLARDLVAAAGGGGGFTALGSLWAEVHRDSLLLLQPAIERHVSPALWEDAVQPLLEAPAFIVPMVLGSLFLVPGVLLRARRRRR